MNDHNVRDEVDDRLAGVSYRRTAAAAPIFNEIENYKTMRRSFNNAFPRMTKSIHTNFSFTIICQIRWFLGVAPGLVQSLKMT